MSKDDKKDPVVEVAGMNGDFRKNWGKWGAVMYLITLLIVSKLPQRALAYLVAFAVWWA
jgi:hypothetical protein